MVVLGVIPLLMLLVIDRERMDDFARTFTLIGAIVLGVGIAIGAASYATGRYVDSRMRKIRLICAQAIGLAADPALVSSEFGLKIQIQADDILGSKEISDPDSAIEKQPSLTRETLVWLLVRTRTRIPFSSSPSQEESETDRILALLN